MLSDGEANGMDNSSSAPSVMQPALGSFGSSFTCPTSGGLANGTTASWHCMGEFAKKLLEDAKVAVSPGIGFGDQGDEYVRFALIENEQRTRQAVRGIKEMFRKDGLL